MKRTNACRWLLVLSVLWMFAPSSASTLWYRTAAERWMEGLPLGNGRIGAVVCSEATREVFHLSEITMWKGAPNENQDPVNGQNTFSQVRDLIMQKEYDKAHDIASAGLNGDMSSFGSHVPLGKATIQMLHSSDNISQYSRTLDLSTGIHKTIYTQSSVTYTRESFCSYPADVLITRFSATARKKISFVLTFDLIQKGEVRSENGMLIIAGRTEEDLSKGVDYLSKIAVTTKGGKIVCQGNTIQVRDADEAILYTDIRTSYQKTDYTQIVDQTIGRSLSTGYSKLQSAHINDFASLFNRVAFSLGEPSAYHDLPTDLRLQRIKEGRSDPGFTALFFQMGRYLAISGSRENSPLPMNLQGVWDDNVACNMPWTNDYHLDINTEQNYWLNNVANLAECNPPLFRFLSTLQKPGRKTAQAIFGTSAGWVANTMCNAWGYTAPGSSIWWGFAPTSGLWLSLQMWQHYQFTADKDFLKKTAYPFFKDLASHYLEHLVKDPVSGYWLSGPSTSPENSFIVDGRGYCLSMMPTYDRALICELFQALIRSCDILETDRSYRDSLQRIVSELPPYQIGKNGQLQEWFYDYQEQHPNHRHTSHLLGLYPFDHISIEKTPDLAEACRLTIERRLSAKGWEDVEFSRANMITYYSRLGLSEKANGCIRSLFQELTGENLLTFSPPGIAGAESEIFIIDGNFAAPAAIAEMLVQSHQGYIHLLPTLPQEWNSGRFKGLCVRGGAEVSVEWSDRQIRSATLTATQDQTFSLFPLKGDYIYTVKGKSIAPSSDESLLSTPLRKGETLKIRLKE